MFNKTSRSSRDKCQHGTADIPSLTVPSLTQHAGGNDLLTCRRPSNARLCGRDRNQCRDSRRRWRGGIWGSRKLNRNTPEFFLFCDSLNKNYERLGIHRLGTLKVFTFFPLRHDSYRFHFACTHCIGRPAPEWRAW